MSVWCECVCTWCACVHKCGCVLARVGKCAHANIHSMRTCSSLVCVRVRTYEQAKNKCSHTPEDCNAVKHEMCLCVHCVPVCALCVWQTSIMLMLPSSAPPLLSPLPLPGHFRLLWQEPRKQCGHGREEFSTVHCASGDVSNLQTRRAAWLAI